MKFTGLGSPFTEIKEAQGTFKNELESIKGIGKNTADQLLNQFKSVKKVKELSEDELVEAVGKSKAKLIRTYFNNGEAQPKIEDKTVGDEISGDELKSIKKGARIKIQPRF